MTLILKRSDALRLVLMPIERITTGLRTEEINAHEIGHVDLKNRILKVEQAIVLKEMKGTKTGKSRDVELNNEAYLAIKRQMKRAMQRTPKMYKGQERRFLWVNSKGNPLCASNFSEKLWKPIFKKLAMKDIKIEYRRPNQLRHTYISHCLKQGDNISWVAKQTGHTIQTLLKDYARHIKDKNHGKIADNYFTKVLHGNESDQYEIYEKTSS